MLHQFTVEPNTLELLKSLMSKSYLKNFVLVGGTALALQIGSRKSIDLDLFTTTDFSSDELLLNLLEDYPVITLAQTPQSIITEIEQVKVDFIRFKYPFIRPVLTFDEIRLLSVEDIAYEIRCNNRTRT